MKKLFPLYASFLFATAASAFAQAPAPDTSTAQAEQAAAAWLQEVDGERYAASWEQSATVFRDAVKKPEWEQGVASLRKQLGKLENRTQKSAVFTTTLPGAPTGEYVVVQYSTTFANRPNSVETVTPVRDTDGTWRVSGYYIQ